MNKKHKNNLQILWSYRDFCLDLPIVNNHFNEKYMRILHTADLHLGQIIYQSYDRCDEHSWFFKQLKTWCIEEKPDALLVSGDIFDIQQPSAATKKAFTDYFADLHRECPDMHIVITAGNHDSASRIQADSKVWEFAGTTLVGVAPQDDNDGWQDKYIVRLKTGYVVAMPYVIGGRKEQLQSILDSIAEENTDGKPVVMMGHAAVTGLDITGHSIIGTLKTQDTESFGSGYDYLALGHIHKPQTIGHLDDAMLEEVVYSAPVARYSGSALHVSCDEAYPHTVSLVDIEKHCGNVKIKQLRIDERRHFYVLPLDGTAFASEEDALDAVERFVKDYKVGYIRLRIDSKVIISSNFNQKIYDLLPKNEEVRYNPNILWEGDADVAEDERPRPTFEVADLQQMTDPMIFIEKTKDQYPEIDIEELRASFDEIKIEVEKLKEEKENKEKNKKRGKSSKSDEKVEEI